MSSSADRRPVLDAIRLIGESGDARLAPVLLDILENTPDNVVRNAAAIALSDLKYRPAVAVLGQLISNPKTEGARGTLVYALRTFASAEHVPLLVDLAANGNFEVSREAVLALEDLNEHFSAAERTREAALIEQALATAADDNRELLRELLRGLQQPHDA